MSKYLTAARDELNYLLENYVSRDVPAPPNMHLAIIANLLSHIEVQNTEASLQRGLAQIKAGEVVDIDWKGSRETDGSLPEPEPDPLDEGNHAERVDKVGDRWSWCDECNGFRLIHTLRQHGPQLGWPVAEIDYHYGPLTFAPGIPHNPDNQQNMPTEYSTNRMHLVYRGDDGTYYYQPWQDVAEVGAWVDPETDEDMDLVGWTTKV